MKRASVFSAASATISLAGLLLGCSSKNPVMPLYDPILYNDGGSGTRTVAHPPGYGLDGGGPGGGSIGGGPGAVYDPGKTYFRAQYSGTHVGVLDVDAPATFARDIYPCDDPWGKIRPTDGALIYNCWDRDLDIEVLRQFVPDEDPAKYTVRDASAPKPGSNDIPVVLPSCFAGSKTFGRWWMAPDTGDIMFICEYGNVTDSYTYASGASFSLSALNIMRAIGYNNTYFAQNAATAPPYFFIVNQDGSRVAVAQGPLESSASVEVATIRATPTGFMLLEVNWNSYTLARWQVAFDGSIVEHVAYPPGPPPHDNKYFAYLALDGRGRAVAFVDGVIVRYDPEAAVGEVLYDRTEYPAHADFAGYGGFFTGP
jgi:hypothetical protein